MFKKISLLMVLVMTLSVFAMGCASDPVENEGGEDVPAVDTSLTDLQARGTMIVGCDDQFLPMGFIGDDDELTGFDLELADLVAEKLGVEAVPKAIDWATKEEELKGGKIDVIWNGYTINTARNELVEYTKPYLKNRQIIAVKADSDIVTKADIYGKILGTQEGSAGLDAIKKDKELVDNISELKDYPTFMYALLDLDTSRLDAVVIDEVYIDYVMTQEEGKYKVLEETMGDEFYGIGFPEGAVALREAVDVALDELYEDGSIETLSVKWFGENIVIRDVEKLTAEDLK